VVDNSPNKLTKVKLVNPEETLLSLSAISYVLYDEKGEIGTFEFDFEFLESGGDPLVNVRHDTEDGVDAIKLVLIATVEGHTKASKVEVLAAKGQVLEGVEIQFAGLSTDGKARWATSAIPPAEDDLPKRTKSKKGLDPMPFVKFKLANSPGSPPIRFFRIRTHTEQNGAGPVRHDERMVDYQAITPPPPRVLFGGQAVSYDADPDDKTVRSIECSIMAGPDQSPRGPELIQDQGRGIRSVDATYVLYNQVANSHVVQFLIATTDENGNDPTQFLQTVFFS
jgi:hypothetical protein